MTDRDERILVSSETMIRVVNTLAKELNATGGLSYETRIDAWMVGCFGPEITRDMQERCYRFLEEALELVQSLVCTREDAHKLVDYVYDRETGDTHQELGGVMVTLTALCNAADLSMERAGEDELTRISNDAVRERIRAKQAAKPQRSPLPGAV